MSIQKLLAAVQAGQLSELDAKRVFRWLERYAQWTSQQDAGQIVIRTESLIELLRQLRDSGKKAFVRLQFVGALEFCQRHVLAVSEPDLPGIRTELEEIALEENGTEASGRPDAAQR